MKEAIKLSIECLSGRYIPWYLSLVFSVIHAALTLLYSSILAISIVAKDAVAFCVILPVVVVMGFLCMKMFQSFRQTCTWWNQYWHWWHEKRCQYYSEMYHETHLHFVTKKYDYHMDQRNRHLYWMMKA